MKSTLTIERQLEKLFSKKQVVTISELTLVLGSRMQIKRKTEEGVLQALGSGLYASPVLDLMTASILAAGMYYPQAVISGLTALVFHNLSDESLDKIDVDVPRGTSIRNRLLNVHRVTQKNITGVSRVIFHRQKIRIYNRERALCEAFKLDSGAIFFKALKRYVKQYSPNIERIANYDKCLRTQVLKHLQQELADA